MPMTNHINSRVRRGFTLIELLVGIVIFAIVGALVTKLLAIQGKFFDRQGMGNAARNVSRSSLNRVISDFRMIEATGGVVAATPTSLTIRIPYAIGVMCANANGGTDISLLPVDSTSYANAGFYGYAWRNFKTGTYSYVQNPATEVPGDPAVCAGVGITTVPNGKVVLVTPALPAGSGLGTPTFLYSQIRYEFAASVAGPRNVATSPTNNFPNIGRIKEGPGVPFTKNANGDVPARKGGYAQPDIQPGVRPGP